MEKRTLRFRTAVKAVMIALLLGVVGKMNAYDFSAVCETGQTLYYNITSATDHYVEIVGPNPNSSTPWGYYQRPTGNIDIPSTVEYNNITYIVKSIGQSAFKDCNELIGYLNIPSMVTTIKSNAFYGCSGFSGSLTIGDSVTTIGDNAFRDCSGFTGSLTIPNSVTSIGNNAFYGCSGFSGNLTIGNSVTKIGEYAFRSCSGLTGNLTIPNSVTEIGDRAFIYCSGFTGNLTLSNSLTEIVAGTFYNCSGLTGSLAIPNSITRIGVLAFYGCGNIININIPETVISIGHNAFNGTGWYNNQPDGILYLNNCCLGYKGSQPTGLLSIIDGTRMIIEQAFYQCSGLTGNLIIPNSVIVIGHGVFYGCSGFSGNLTIGNSVTTIEDGAFGDCSGFSGSLIIPNSVITIGEYAFYGCSGFTGSLNIGSSVTTIGQDAFQNCSFHGLNINMVNIPGNFISYIGGNFSGTLTIGNSAATIGDFAFFECSSLTQIIIPDSVISIGNYAFEGTGWYNNQSDGILYLDGCCLGYKGEQPTGDLYIQEGTRIVADYAFIECYSLSTVVIPNTVTHIGSFAFFCTSISEVSLSNSLTSIENNVFNSCNFLTSIDIPNTVTSIGDGAFSNCMNLTTANIPDGVTYIGRDAFMFTNLNSLTLPSSLQTIEGCAFSACFNLSGTLVIPNSVTTIEEEAFYLCDSLTSLTIGNSVSYIGQRAFNCSGLTSIIVLTETPPELQIYYGGPFASVDKSIPVQVPYGTMAAFQAAQGWNEFTDYQEMPPVNTTQTINLNAGWNWFSTYLDISLQQLEEALGDNVSNITSQNDGFVSYINGIGWTGELNAIASAKMYKVQAVSETSVTISGTPVNPANNAVTLNPGDNWIGYPLSQSLNLNEAFAGANPMNGDKVSSYGGYAQYYNGVWYGELQALEPGKGYIYKSNADEVKTFVIASGRQK